MDLELLKTFLEVQRVRHFGKAADNLFITPSAVSARIRLLEEQLGVKLFHRTRNNIQLTDSGERLLNHAKALVGSWEKARYDVVSGAGTTQQLSILGVPSLWDTVLLPWVCKLRSERPELLLRMEALPSDEIWRKLQQNQADLGFMFEPHTGPELHWQECGSLELHMVATVSGASPEDLVKDNYIMVDWGNAFQTRHNALYPHAPIPSAWVSTGRMAFDLLQAGGGCSCYLPEFMVKGAVKSKRLFRVKEAPEIRLIIYAAYPVWAAHEKMYSDLLLDLTSDE